MAVTITMTGTGRNCTLTSGQSTIVVSDATAIALGATIQGTGIPTGTRVGKIVGQLLKKLLSTSVKMTWMVKREVELIFTQH